MIVNVRIKEARLHRRLESGELARLANVSPAALSLIEKQVRIPRVDTLQKIAAALDVSTSYLLGEEDTGLPLPRALARQSLKIFLRDTPVEEGQRTFFEKVSSRDSAPQSVRGWSDLLANLLAYERRQTASTSDLNLEG